MVLVIALRILSEAVSLSADLMVESLLSLSLILNCLYALLAVSFRIFAV